VHTVPTNVQRKLALGGQLGNWEHEGILKNCIVREVQWGALNGGISWRFLKHLPDVSKWAKYVDLAMLFTICTPLFVTFVAAAIFVLMAGNSVTPMEDACAIACLAIQLPFAQWIVIRFFVKFFAYELTSFGAFFLIAQGCGVILLVGSVFVKIIVMLITPERHTT